MATSEITVCISNIDFPALRKQKQALLQAIDRAGADAAELTGILHLLDAIQDKAAEQCEEAEIFGESEEG